MRADTPSPGAATGGVLLLLRLEGLAALIASVAAFFWLGGPWWLLAVLFFLPDIAFLAYAAGPGPGAIAYNATHWSLGALALLAIGFVTANVTLQQVGLVWAAHIGFDRALGYGLKYAGGFGLTHLGRIGRGGPKAAP